MSWNTQMQLTGPPLCALTTLPVVLLGSVGRAGPAVFDRGVVVQNSLPCRGSLALATIAVRYTTLAIKLQIPSDLTGDAECKKAQD